MGVEVTTEVCYVDLSLITIAIIDLCAATVPAFLNVAAQVWRNKQE
jgi:hypothetical protein